MRELRFVKGLQRSESSMVKRILPVVRSIIVAILSFEAVASMHPLGCHPTDVLSQSIDEKKP